jgi:UDP-2,3-diacylglucosamine pyrophosphatase LpxH
MRSQENTKVAKTILVISDIHLGAGSFVEGRKNYLEDFHYDSEMVEFLNYYSRGIYLEREVELIINGDMFDLLAVPYVRYFDDQFWSEKASLEKLQIIFKAHKEVMNALAQFVRGEDKSVTFIIGNHDAEFMLPSLQKEFLNVFREQDQKKVKILLNFDKPYEPVPGVILKHGHEYEFAHRFSPQNSVVENLEGKRYFLPPWGSYYVTRIINKFKAERYYVNAVRPIRKFLINGLVYDTLFTLRFMFSNAFYFIMVRFLYTFKQGKKWREIMLAIKAELVLFHDLEEQVNDFFRNDPSIKVLIVGHTHEPIYRVNSEGQTFINTGTWTRMHHLDIGKRGNKSLLTYAQLDVIDNSSSEDSTETRRKLSFPIQASLHIWEGERTLPYSEFTN